MDKLTIRKENILVKDDATNAEEIIMRLGKLLYDNGYVRETYVPAVLAREKVFPTGLQTTAFGFAIPHTDAAHVFHSALAIATLRSPVVFKAMDNPEADIRVSLVMMLAISDPAAVVDTLTKVISLLEDEPRLMTIWNATSKEEIRKAVGDHIRKMTRTRSVSPGDFGVGH